MESKTQFTDRIVANYLSKRGLTTTEHALRQEARLKGDFKEDFEEDSIANFVLFYNEDEANNPKAYEASYQKLVKWVDDSIDIYKLELRRILYPVFVHAFLDLVAKGLRDFASTFFETYKDDHNEEHSQDLIRLSCINDPIQLATSELVVNFRQNKYGIIMSKYSFELLLCFLQDNKFMLILRLMNQYITIEATSDKPGSYEVNEDGMGLLGTNSSLSHFNQQDIRLGRLHPDPLFYGDIERALATQIHSDKALLLDQVHQELNEVVSEESPQIDDVPLPPKKLADVTAELNYFRDIRARVQLSESSLPSICMYTFHNTNDELNCLKSSANADYIAAGFADSLVKLWTVSSTKPDIPAQPCSQLIGHSGPVFGLDFSSDGNYLLSASEDKTVRLWSLETKSNLVCYRGHNYPVFDVTFAPQGFYFASASLDKTARLWSTDHLFPLRLFVGHLSDVDVVRFHPNCNYLMTGSSDHTCRLWDIQTGHCVRIFAKHKGMVTAVAMSPCGQMMASAGSDYIIRLWDLGSGNVIKEMSGHDGTITSLEFSKNGSILASSGADDSVRLWKVKDSDLKAFDTTAAFGQTQKREKSLKSFPTKRTPVYSVSFTNRNILVALGVFQK